MLVMLITIAMCVAIGYGFLRFMVVAAALSKVAVTLLIAWVIGNSNLIIGGDSFHNFLICAGMIGIICLLLRKLPKISCAYQFFCSSVVTFVLGVLGFNMVSTLFDVQENIIKIAETSIKVMSLVVGVVTTVNKIQNQDTMNKFDHAAPAYMERFVASLLYGLAITIVICISNNYDVPSSLEWIIMLTGMMITFVGDILLFGDNLSESRWGQTKDSPVVKSKSVSSDYEFGRYTLADTDSDDDLKWRRYEERMARREELEEALDWDRWAREDEAEREQQWQDDRDYYLSRDYD